MNDLIIKSDVKIEDMIYIVRDRKVMLDSDLAKLYGYLNGAKSINLIVKRNIDKFNNSIYFKLTESEFSNLRFQFETSSLDNYGRRRNMPNVLSKEGIEVLGSIIKKAYSREITDKIIKSFEEKDSLIVSSNAAQTVINKGVNINDLIYNIRGKLVMLDSDLAKLYQCINGTKMINQAVKRNTERFPEDFYFKLEKEEYLSILRSQNVTLELEQGKYAKYLPYAFTEQGVAMLSTVLRTENASVISVSIMRAFVMMKKIINTNLIEQRYINNLVLEHDSSIKLLKESLDKLSSKEEINHIFYEGQIYDAYSLLIKVLSKSKKEIIIIDNYAGRELFNIIKDIKVNIKVYTENIDNIAKEKYEKQYNNLTIFTTNIFHDRFIIIDNKVLYHSGASFKDLGKKCFAITKIEDKKIIKDLQERLKKV